MKQYLTTRYPQSKKHGGVDRAWLLEQRHTAKYPNLLVEVALHPLPPAVLAIRAGMSEDVLIDCLLGCDSITWPEAHALLPAMRTNAGSPSFDFSFRQELTPFEECESGDGLRTARRLLRRIKLKHPAIPLLKELLKEDVPPDAAVMLVDAFADFEKPENERNTKIIPRLLSKPEEEEEDEA